MSIRSSKVTGRILAKAMQAFLRRMGKSGVKHGKQSVKSLTKHGTGLETVEVSGEDIGSFKKTARKYNMDFALQKDKTQDPPRWVVFFKAKDSKTLEHAFKEFSRAILKPSKGNKPPMLEKLDKFKEVVKTTAPPAKDRNRGEISV